MQNQERILLVDDESRILTALSRRLEDEYIIDTATTGKGGLLKLKDLGPYAIVISDLRMPNMDGIEFLSEVARLYPSTVRILLTGYADIPSATRAINQTGIFRLLTKPCSQETVQQALEDGLKRYRDGLIEREMLNKTLRGSLDVISEIVKLTDPLAYEEQPRAKRLAIKISHALGIKSSVKLELAIMLSNIGSVTIPFSVLLKLRSDEDLDPTELKVLEQLPKASRDLVMKIPRLEEVAEVILYQEKHFDGGGFPKDERKGDEIPLLSRILKATNDFMRASGKGASWDTVLEQMNQQSAIYDPRVLSALNEVVKRTKGRPNQNVAVRSAQNTETRIISINQIEIGDILVKDLFGALGVVLIQAGTVVTEKHLNDLIAAGVDNGSEQQVRVLRQVQPPVHEVDAH